jgi:transposase-like protein
MMSVSRVIEKVTHGWMGRDWKRRLQSSPPRQSFTLQTMNVLNAMPKSVQPKAKSDLHEIYRAGSREDADKAVDRFVAKYGAKYDRATACLTKDRTELLAFYDFPAEHWKHLRSSHPIESTFATVRLRTDKTKGCLSRATALAMVFELAKSAERTWRKLDGSEQLGQLIEGIRFRDGEPVQDAEACAAA